jgi:hypothetical protein
MYDAGRERIFEDENGGVKHPVRGALPMVAATKWLGRNKMRSRARAHLGETVAWQSNGSCENEKKVEAMRVENVTVTRLVIRFRIMLNATELLDS